MVGVSAEVEREMRVRRRILDIFNERREDFATLREYNDHLEMVEDTIFSLVNDDNTEETEARVEAYRRANAEQITLRKAKQTNSQLMETHNPPPPATVTEDSGSKAQKKMDEDQAGEDTGSLLLQHLGGSGGGSGGVHAVYNGCIRLAQRRAKEEAIAALFF